MFPEPALSAQHVLLGLGAVLRMFYTCLLFLNKCFKKHVQRMFYFDLWDISTKLSGNKEFL